MLFFDFQVIMNLNLLVLFSEELAVNISKVELTVSKDEFELLSKNKELFNELIVKVLNIIYSEFMLYIVS